MPVYSRKVSKGLLWFYQFYSSGKTYKSKTIFYSKQEAKQAESRAYQEVLQRQKYPAQAQDVDMKKAIDERLDYVKVRKSKVYYADSKRYLSILYHSYNNVSEVTKSDIEKILQQQVQRGTYVTNAILRAFKAFFNYTIQNYDLDMKNPCQHIKPFGVEKRIKLIPPDKDINTLIKYCTPEQKMLIEFLRDTGARLSEALNLVGRDLTTSEVTLYTRKSLNSNLVPRRVPKPECLAGQIFPPEAKIFGHWTEQPKFLERKLKMLKLPRWGFHNLRHRYASKLSAEGKPIFEIMSLLGHSNVETTQKYLQLLPRSG